MSTGGGAVEAALSIYLENFANTLGSREQLAIAEFADALLVIPKTLAVNAAKDATELVAKLRAYHYTAQASLTPACLVCLTHIYKADTRPVQCVSFVSARGSLRVWAVSFFGFCRPGQKRNTWRSLGLICSRVRYATMCKQECWSQS